MNKNYSLDELECVAREIIQATKYRILLFYGPMGVGKTTLIKEICKQLGVEDSTHSPSFSLVNEYLTNDETTIYHFDFYRINDENEAYDIGIEEYLYSGSWALVEWAENISNLIPIESTKIYLSILRDGQRNIRFKNNDDILKT